MMKNLFYLFIFILSFSYVHSQERELSPYYYERSAYYEQLTVKPTDIVMLGNSLTEGGKWSELFNNENVINRGISGDVTTGVYQRLDPILKGTPAKIFMLIGINDVSWGIPADSIVMNIEMIVQKIKKDSPATKLYLQSVLPFDDVNGKYKRLEGKFHLSQEINILLEKLAQQEELTYIELYPHFLDECTGKLNAKYTNDGLHLIEEGYVVWRDLIQPYIEE